MIFWILLGLTVIAIVIMMIFVPDWRHEHWRGISGWVVFSCTVVPIAGVLVMLITLPIIASTGPQVVRSTTQLAALSTGDGITGHFFLGSGTVDSKRVLNYIADDDGLYTLEQVDADKATIRQGDYVPHVDQLATVRNDWWLAPFPVVGSFGDYAFYIPAGSILESYQIQN